MATTVWATTDYYLPDQFSLCASSRSSKTFSLAGPSKICVKILSQTPCRSLQDCLCPAVLPFQESVSSSPWEQGPSTSRCHLVAWKVHPLPFMIRLSITNAHHSIRDSCPMLWFWGIQIWQAYHPSGSRAPCFKVIPLCRAQPPLLGFPACASWRDCYPSITAVQSSELPHCISAALTRSQLYDRAQSFNFSFLSLGLEKLE